jgi:predicted transcriptional regulator
MEKTLISVRIDSQLRRALDRAAKDDARSLSSLLVKIINDWMKQQKEKAR